MSYAKNHLKKIVSKEEDQELIIKELAMRQEIYVKEISLRENFFLKALEKDSEKENARREEFFLKEAERRVNFIPLFYYWNWITDVSLFNEKN